jgi:small conductance mechanosensitive channel
MALSDPEPFVRMSEHGQSSINITARVWVKSKDYWTVRFDILESVKKAFDDNNITIPYNQLDVHVKDETKGK